MAEDNIGLKTVSELLGMKFFIPSYQRGYRWTTRQVRDVLDDICDFKPQNDEWYCLQPLVVKQKDNKWEVIDGQQRLTTIFLIIHYINEMWTGKQKNDEPTITYQTRNDSYKFLKDMKIEDNGDIKIDSSNIDYQHISSAYKAIDDWKLEKEKGKFDQNDFQSKFKEKTKVIWYETNPEQDGRDIFTRINIGKIPLTSAELIKALFLNRKNFKTGNSVDEEKIRLKQLEIATEWDIIETALHNEEFWLFLNKEDNSAEVRIEFIFELLVGKATDLEDNYFTFRKFREKIMDNTDSAEQNITNNWKEIKRCFQMLQNWFEDRELYHKIGFLITTGENIKTMLDQTQRQNKSDFIALIDGNINKKFAAIKLDALDYDNVGDKKNIKNILLMHNIQTMLDNEKENSRFPFNRYKREQWDIEHIHAIAEEMPNTEQHQKDWLLQANDFIDDPSPDDLKNRIDNYSRNTFEQLFNDILKFFNENKQHEDINDLSNLVLLDAETNRGYKNAVFPVKRKIIIEKEKHGTFVPICTKNVFMKYYSLKIEQMTFWGRTDRDAYIEDIKMVLKKYLPEDVKKDE